MFTLQHAIAIVLIGVGATLVLDLWLAVLQRLGIPTGSFALIGRWVAHLARGRLRHAAIAQSAPVRHELMLGWATHYAVGITFAAVLVALQSTAWLHQPRFAAALLTGLATVVLPLFVMQPAMGAGLASTKTATPLKNCARSVANHAVFGIGLYVSALMLAPFLE